MNVGIRLHINPRGKCSIHAADNSNNNKVTTTNIPTVINKFKIIV